MSQLEALRRQLAVFGQPARGRRYPPQLRHALCVWLRAEHQAGRRWSDLAAGLGLPAATLLRLADSPVPLRPVRPVSLVPVVAVAQPEVSRSLPELRLILPSGIAVVGLGLDDVAQLLRWLA